MEQDTGIFILVPADVGDCILREGYHCTRRRRVPASHNIEVAQRAYRRHQRSRPPMLLKVTGLPIGVQTVPHKDGIKLSTTHLPAYCLEKVVRGHSVPSTSMMPSSSFQPPTRASSTRFRPPVDPITFAEDNGRYRVVGRSNVQDLYHCTSKSNAENILLQQAFRPGTRGFLGPGIYFSKTPYYAERYCQCRTGNGPRVVLRCRVDMGKIKQVGKGTPCTSNDLVREGCDCFQEIGRDCVMIPNMDKKQIVSLEPTW